VTDRALLSVSECQVSVGPGSGVCCPASWCHCGFLASWPLVVLPVLFVSLFDSPCFFLTSLVCLVSFVFKGVSEFRGELAAVEANGPYSHPPSLNADVAGLDVPFADPGLRFTLGAFGAEVVGLKFHLRSTINALRFWGR
jgi:hypothetical protein